MKALAQFLKEEAVQQRAQADAIAADVQAWERSVNRLVQQMEDWLRLADPERILRIETTTHYLREEGIGQYILYGLSILLGAREVEVIPVARKVVAVFDDDIAPARRAQGRVDLTNGEWKYMLYRFVLDQDDRWMIVDDRDYRKRPFDQSSFEEAMVSLLE
jgi:hypothetical protein